MPRSKVDAIKALRKRLMYSVNPDGRDLSLADKYQIHEKIFSKYESVLDNPKSGPTWLKDQRLAKIVMESIHHRDGHLYDLFAYCIMSNHVHLIFEHFIAPTRNQSRYPISNIMRDLKKFTARECNIILNRSGEFWQVESYDHLIRDNHELETQINYTLQNPVKAGLVEKWEDWPYTYCKKEFRESFL